MVNENLMMGDSREVTMLKVLKTIGLVGCLSVSSAGLAAAASLSLDLLLTSGGPETELDYPIKVTFAPGDTNNLYIVNRVEGNVRLYDRTTNTLSEQPYLQLPPELFVQSPNPFDGNQTYTLTFDPKFQETGKLYVSFIDQQDDLRVVEFTANPQNPTQVDTSTYRNIVAVDYNGEFHQGGDIDFGPDGHLYITTGDGRPPNAPNSEIPAQDLGSLEGKILRIDPNSADAFPFDDLNNFTPSPDNPFVVAGQAAKITDAIWATGFRNPFQAAFDPVTKAYVIADIGEDLAEEINIGIAGGNYGWPLKEGSGAHPPGTILIGGQLFVDPLYEYSHASFPNGASITGGIFYNGAISGLVGRYFFGDFVTNQIGSLRLDPSTLSYSDLMFFDLITSDLPPSGLLSFGAGPDGEMYIVALNGIYKVTGSDAVAVSPIPIPAPLLLLASGIGAVAAVARRRRRPGERAS
jgi:glucose/arabinose dehydrogenase